MRKEKEMAYDLHSIGQALKSIRKEKGLTIEEVSKVLSIEKRIIEGIESGTWTNLPEPFFVKGYVNHYMAFLEIADELKPGVVPGRRTEDGSKQKSGTSSVAAAVMMGLRGASEDPEESSASLAGR
jgi:hypothetical protein